MGLREIKAARTRELIIDVALELFERQGYEETTMEEIAIAAEVGVSTLYRYFPLKKLLLDSLTDEWKGVISGNLQNRPVSELPAVALKAALIDGLQQAEIMEARIFKLRAVLDRTPVARAGLWDLWIEERLLIAEELGRRTGMVAGHPRVILAAMIVEGIASLALDMWRDDPARPAPSITATQYLGFLGELESLL